MDYKQWLTSVPSEIRADPVWKLEVYRFALYASDIAWDDIAILSRNRRTVCLINQLYRSIGSIGANICEGYSHRSKKDQARYYEYALGSAREARTWYYQVRHVLPEVLLSERLQLLSRIIRLLLHMIPERRGGIVKEEDVSYWYDEGANLLARSCKSSSRITHHESRY